VNGITLLLFGGVSGLGEEPSPAAEARIADRLRGARAGQIMTPDPVTVPGSMTVTEFLADYFYRARHQAFPVTRAGQGTVPGLVTLDRIRHVPARERDHIRLADIACPLTDVARAAPGGSVAGILPRLTEGTGRGALVFSNRAPGRDPHAQRRQPHGEPSQPQPVPVARQQAVGRRLSLTI